LFSWIHFQCTSLAASCMDFCFFFVNSFAAVTCHIGYYHVQQLCNLAARPGMRSHRWGYWRTCQLLNSFWTFASFRRKVARNSSTGLFPELTLDELVFLCHKHYSIFLLQQEASVL
jgi:hypothetical protein